MKKVSRIIAIALGVILLLLILTPFLFRSKIESLVKEKVNEQVMAEVDWTRFSLSFFRGFPKLSIGLHEVSVVGIDAFAGDTLVGLKRFELRVKPFSVLGKELIVSSFVLDRPLINAQVLEDGRASWDIVPEADTPEMEEQLSEKEGGGAMSLKLNRLAIQKGRIYYHDQAGDIEASLEDFNLELSGDFSASLSELTLRTDIDKVTATLGGTPYLRDANFHLLVVAAADLEKGVYTLKDNLITLNGLSLGAKGVVRMEDDGSMDLDLVYFSKETSFKTLLSLVPAVYLQDFESLKTSGELKLDGIVKGQMKDSILPDVTLHLQVIEGYFAYPDLPENVSDVNISLEANYSGKNMDESTVNLKGFHFVIAGNPFDVSLQADHPVSDLHVSGSAVGLINLSSLKDALPLEDINLSGQLETDLHWDTRLSYIEEERFDEVDLAGKLIVEQLVVESEDLPVPVQLHRMDMLFNPRQVELKSLKLGLGDSDMELDGALENFIPYVFRGETVKGKLNLRSSYMNLNQLLPEDEDEVNDDLPVSDTLLPAPPDSLAVPGGLKIPMNIDFLMSLRMDEIIYGDLQIRNLKGNMKLHDGIAELEELAMEAVDGSISTSGLIDTRGEYTSADLGLLLDGIDIPLAYENFMTVEKLLPLAGYCKGSATVKLALHTLLDASLSPLYESINASGLVRTKDIEVGKTKSLETLGSLLNNEKITHLSPRDMNVRFRIRNGRIEVDPFNVRFSDSKMRVSGSHGIDLSMDYLLDMEIDRDDLGAGANQLLNSVNVLAASAGMQTPQSETFKVKVKVGGDFNNPAISTDLSGNIQSGREEVQKVVHEKIKEEASEQADRYIKEAEEEAARLIKEAENAGKQLVDEARKQGEKLKKEAGSNPLKQLAAKAAADELVRQAQNQSDKLIREAEAKSAEVIADAKKRAEKI